MTEQSTTGSEQSDRVIPEADCPGCDDGTILEVPEAGYATCADCGERGYRRGDSVEWWRNDPDSQWYVEDDEPEIRTDGGVKQATLDGGEAETTDRHRPGTFVYCEECEEPVLRSRRLDHEHDLSDADTPTDAQQKLIEEKVPEHALLDTQTWEITFHDEYVERVRVEATTKGEAQEKAENERTYDGELMQTIHTERRALSDPSQATIEYLEFHGLLPEDHDVTPSDLQKLADANSGDSR